jgi:hypothetical protein
MATFNFPPTSRYFGIETATFTASDGHKLTYLRRRFLPAPESFALLQIHVVTEGERLDNIAATLVGDPTAFWRIADANGAMRAEALTETVGRKLRITLPQGVPGTPNA